MAFLEFYGLLLNIEYFPDIIRFLLFKKHSLLNSQMKEQRQITLTKAFLRYLGKEVVFNYAE